MHTGEKRIAISPLLRLGGIFTGAFVGALAAAVLFFVGAVLDLFDGSLSFPTFLAGIGFVGAFVGFALPRQTISFLWFIFPEIWDRD
jgi:hypothetical protein